MATLSEDDIRQRLASLEGWRLVDRALCKEFQFASFPEAILFVNAVAHLAELLDHHPDVEIHYRRVKLTLWTHSEGGVTEKDIRAAQLIEQRLRKT